MPKRTWSHDEDVTFTRLYMAGGRIADIAAALERTEPMIKNRANMLGLRRRKLKDGSTMQGNAVWLIGESLRSAVPKINQPFAQDLLDMLE